MPKTLILAAFSKDQRTYVEFERPSEDGSKGRLLVFQQKLSEIFDSRDVEMPDEPLTKRAWAFQERTFSQRTIFFGKDQLCFECNNMFDTEDGICHQSRHRDIYRKLEATAYTATLNLKLWYGLLEEYTSRQLSRWSDKLPALAGLARIFRQRIGGEYVAGLWSIDLMQGLFWEHNNDRPAGLKPSSAPSWSWASYDGKIRCIGLYEGHDLAQLLDYNVHLTTTNPFGEVTDCWIQLEAPMIPVLLVKATTSIDEDSLVVNGLLRLGLRYNTYNKISFDHACQSDEQAMAYYKSISLSALVLQRAEQKTDEASAKRETQYVALIVAAGLDQPSKMRRVASVRILAKQGPISIIEDPSSLAKVTLY